jgi:hypothetical protein
MNLTEQINKTLEAVFIASGINETDTQFLKEQVFKTIFLKMIVRISDILSVDELRGIDAQIGNLPNEEKIGKLQEFLLENPKGEEILKGFMAEDLTETVGNIVDTFMGKATDEEKEKYNQTLSQ